MYFPDKETFRKQAEQGNLVPVFREIMADQDTPVSAYDKLRTALKKEMPKPYTFLLESVEGGENIARYSFLGGKPRAIFTATRRQVEIETLEGERRVLKDVDPLDTLRSEMSVYKPVHNPELPRFIGGAVGYLGYDAVAQFDKVPLADAPGLGWPDMIFMIADTIIIFDHVRHTVKLVANAYIDNGELDAAYDSATERIDQLMEYLATPIERRVLDPRQQPEDLPLRSNMEPEEFKAAVEQTKEYIRAGDIIQAVLSQRFEVDGSGDPLDVYRALRAINPSPYMYCLELGEYGVAGSSPEVHVRSEEGAVDIRPIAGTRPRSSDPEKDKAFEVDLLADPKERAEHVMLVDLARNDIGRVCAWGSVEVSEFMVIERYSHVMHIVSNVTGKLDPAKDAYDLMRATFPAGTLSGAPKIRAMQIIAEKETALRGVYGGAVGYFGFDGNLDCAIAIRTALLDGDKTYVQAGAGIVADSDPQMEYEETCNKARGMLKAIALSRKYAQGGTEAGA